MCSCASLLVLLFAFLPTAVNTMLLLHIHALAGAEAEHGNIEVRKEKLFFKVASKSFLFIIFVQKLSHHWKERKNHTLESSKLQFRDPYTDT